MYRQHASGNTQGKTYNWYESTHAVLSLDPPQTNCRNGSEEEKQRLCQR
jgi:hypothetical protein